MGAGITKGKSGKTDAVDHFLCPYPNVSGLLMNHLFFSFPNLSKLMCELGNGVINQIYEARREELGARKPQPGDPR